MRNFIFTFFLCISFCLSVKSQTSVYKPFPQVYGDWVTEEYWYSSGYSSPPTHTLYYTAPVDTVYGGHTYKKVNKGYTGTLPPYYSYTHTAALATTYCFSYRNDSLNRKVYILLKDSLAEQLWYDFNMSVGDSLNIHSYVRSIYNSNAKVTSIDSILICGSYHKRFNFVCTPSAASFSESLIEGEGFTSNFIHTDLAVCAFEPSYLCSTSYSSKDYCPSEPSQVSLLLGVENQYYQDNFKLTLMPDPVSSELKIEIANVNIKSFSYSILDRMGRMVSEGELNNASVIDVSTFKTGLYFIRITDKKEKFYNSKFIKD